MKTGKVHKYIDDRGFGFVRPDGSYDEIFFHISDVKDNALPKVDDYVSFEIAAGRNGKSKAIKVNVYSEEIDYLKAKASLMEDGKGKTRALTTIAYLEKGSDFTPQTYSVNSNEDNVRALINKSQSWNYFSFKNNISVVMNGVVAGATLIARVKDGVVNYDDATFITSSSVEVVEEDGERVTISHGRVYHISTSIGFKDKLIEASKKWAESERGFNKLIADCREHEEDVKSKEPAILEKMREEEEEQSRYKDACNNLQSILNSDLKDGAKSRSLKLFIHSIDELKLTRYHKDDLKLTAQQTVDSIESKWSSRAKHIFEYRAIKLYNRFDKRASLKSKEEFLSKAKKKWNKIAKAGPFGRNEEFHVRQIELENKLSLIKTNAQRRLKKVVINQKSKGNDLDNRIITLDYARRAKNMIYMNYNSDIVKIFNELKDGVERDLWKRENDNVSNSGVDLLKSLDSLPTEKAKVEFTKAIIDRLEIYKGSIFDAYDKFFRGLFKYHDQGKYLVNNDYIKYELSNGAYGKVLRINSYGAQTTKCVKARHKDAKAGLSEEELLEFEAMTEKNVSFLKSIGVSENTIDRLVGSSLLGTDDLELADFDVYSIFRTIAKDKDSSVNARLKANSIANKGSLNDVSSIIRNSDKTVDELFDLIKSYYSHAGRFEVRKRFRLEKWENFLLIWDELGERIHHSKM